MKQVLSIVVVGLVFALPGLCLANARVSQPEDPEDNEEQYELDAQDGEQVLEQQAAQDVALVGWHHHHRQPASAPAPAEAAAPVAATDAANAHQAAKVAKHAAKIANRVAKHSIKVTGHAKKALKHALGALHDARVETSGLDKSQKESLKKAEGHLREATKTAEFGKLKKVKDDNDLKKEKMQEKMDKSKTGKTEKEELLEEIQEIRKMLKDKNVEDKEINKALDDLEAEVKKGDGASSDETKAEIERLRELVEKMDPDDGKLKYDIPKTKGEGKDEKNTKGEGKDEKDTNGEGKDAKNLQSLESADQAATPIQEKGIDIDTQMPYGDLEPFGREDTAQELTERSITESDEMVDQLERAEVAEEKRAVFRALTRLRGAAITSYDGVARSQTGNIDEYNKVHKWRKTHPVHHLADEEADVTKWAFPDNAD